MSDIETAEEFITNNALPVNGIKPLEARDAAVAREAKLAVLDEFDREVQHLFGTGLSPASAHFMACQRLRAKYEKEPDGEAQ